MHSDVTRNEKQKWGWLFLGLVKPETQKQAIMASGMLFSVNGKHNSFALNLYIS